MATIDELSIEVQSSAKEVDNSIDKAAKQLEHLASATSKVSASKLNSISGGLKNISNSLRGLKDVSSAIKSLQGLSNISNVTKGLGKSKKTTSGLDQIKASIDTKDFDSAVDELQKSFQDAGKNFEFKGNSSQLEQEIKKLEKNLDRLYERQDEFRDLGKNINTEGFIKLQRNIALTKNKLDILKSQLKNTAKETGTLSSGPPIQKWNDAPQKSIPDYRKGLEEVKKDIKSIQESFGGFPNVPKGTLDNVIGGLKIDLEELRKRFPNATKEIAAFEEEIKRLQSIASGLTMERTPFKVNADTKSIDKANEKIRELRNKFKKTDLDFKFTGNFEQLNSEIKEVQQELKGLKTEEKEMISAGKVDTSDFEKLQKAIVGTGNKLVVLKDLRNETKKFNQSLQQIKVPEIHEENLGKLQNALRKTDEQTEKLRIKLENGITMRDIVPNISDRNFRKLTEQIALSERQAEALRNKITEIEKVNQNSASAGIDSIQNSLKDASLTAEQFEEYLKNIRIPEIREANLGKLQSELERTEKKLDELTAKSDNWANKGINPDSTKFRNLQEQIVITSRRADALRERIEEVGRTKPQVSGWQKLTAVASLIDKSFNSIKRGVKKAMESVRKLGRVFQNLHSIVKNISSAIGKMFHNIANLASKATSAIASSAKGISNVFSKLRGANSGIQSMTSNLESLAKAAGSLLAVKGIINFGKEAVKLGSDITEVENVVDTAFGSMADKAYDFAATAKENFGLSELAAKQYSGTMMAMLKSSGIGQEAASNMSITLAGLAGDIASFYNIETEDAFRKLRSGIAGQTAPLKQLGINMNIANLEAYAMSQGIGKAYREMSLSEQTLLRYNYILAKTGDSQGDFARTAGTWANQARLLKLNLQSVSAIIGQGLIAALLPAIKLLNKFMDKLTQAAKKFRDFMYVLFGKKIEGPKRGVVDDMADMVDYETDLSGIGSSAEDVGDGMDDASDGMESATDSAKKLKKALSVLGFDELNQLNANLDDLDTSKIKGDKGKNKDLGLDDIGTGNMDDMFDDLYDKSEVEPINEWAKRLREAFLNHDWEGLGKTIAEMINIGLKKIYDGIKALTPKVEQALRAFAKVFNSFVKWLDWDLLGRTIGAGINLLSRAFNALFGPGGIDLEQLGRKLSVGLRGMIDEVDWRELGNAIGNYFMIAWRIASGFVEDMWRINPDTLTTGWEETGNALAEGVHGIFERINFKQIGETISGGFNGIIEIISSFRDRMASNHTWSKIAIGVSEGFNSIIDNIDLSRAAQEIGGLALDILHAMNQSAELTHWSEFGYKVAEGLFSVPWLQLFDNVFNFVSATFGEALGGFVSYLTTHAEELGERFAYTFNYVFDKIKYITSSIPWDDIGTGISTFLNTSIEKIKPIQAATNLGNFVTSLLGTMIQVAQSTNWNELGVAIGNFIASIPWGTMFRQAFDIITTTIGGLVSGIGSTLLYQLPVIGTAIAEGFNYAIERLREFVANVSWEDIGLYISTGINNLILGVDWVTAGETLSNFVRGLLDVFYAVAMNTDWEAFGRSIGEFLGNIDWLGILTEFALSLGTIIAEVIDGLRETVSGNIVLAIGGVILAAKGVGLANSALEMVNEFAHNFGLLPEGVNLTIPKLVEGISKIAGEGGILSKISSTAKTVATNAGSFLGKLGSVVFSPHGALIAAIVIGVALIVANWDKIKEAAGKVKDWVSDKFDKLKESVSKSMDKLKENVGNAWEKAQEKFQKFDNFLTNIFSRDWTNNFGIFGEALNAFFKNVSNIWESIKRIFEGVIEFVAGVFTGDWKRAWNGVKEIFGGIWDGLVAVVKRPVNAIIGILNALISAVAFAVNSVGEILNSLKIDIPKDVPIIGGLSWHPNFPKWTPGKLNYLAKGGVLKRGQVGILEGNGAEAVVPLEKNRQWISKVSEEMARNNYNYSGGVINEDMLANAIAEGVAMALMNNIDNLSGSSPKYIQNSISLDGDVLLMAVTKAQDEYDYRMNPTPQFG